MKLSILQEKLKEGLQIVERICSKSISLPILNNILLKTEKNFLIIEATDLKIGIRYQILSKVEKEGKVVIPSHLFSNFINFLPQKPVSLMAQNQILDIECENYKTKIKGFNPDEFPILPKITEGESLLCNIQDFCQGLSQVVDFPSLSTTKPEISGVFFSFQKDLIIMAATDTFRLGEKKVYLKKPNSLTKEYSFILPQKTTRELINIFEAKEGEIKVYFSPNQVLFEFLMEEIPQPQIQLISRLIEGDYPSYQEIIPKKFDTQVVLSKNEFLNQIKITSLFSGKSNEVKLTIDPKDQKIEFFSQSPDLGEHYSCLVGKIKGKAIEVSFNYKFLIDGLLNIKSSQIIFELNGEDRPGILKPFDDQSYIYIVMPIKRF